jgi:hypothetical protein
MKVLNTFTELWKLIHTAAEVTGVFNGQNQKREGRLVNFFG